MRLYGKINIARTDKEIIHLHAIYNPSRHTTLKQRRFNVDVTSQRHIDVDMTLLSRHVSALNV